MIRTAPASTLSFAMLSVMLLAPLAAAHVTHTTGASTLRIGWGSEPPQSELPNHITMQAWTTDTGEAVTGLVGNVTLAMMHGGESKSLDVAESDEAPGNYSAPIEPMEPGLYVVHANGTVNGATVNQDFAIEAVNDIKDIQFPAKASADERLAAMQSQIDALKAKAITQSTTPATVTAQQPAKGTPAFELGLVLAAVAATATILMRRRG